MTILANIPPPLEKGGVTLGSNYPLNVTEGWSLKYAFLDVSTMHQNLLLTHFCRFLHFSMCCFGTLKKKANLYELMIGMLE